MEACRPVSENRIVWVDLETVGLKPENGQVLEVGIKVTDDALVEISKASWVVHLTDENMTRLDDWALIHHGRNGLLAATRKSEYSMGDVEKMALRYLSLPQTDVEARTHPMGGNTIGFDRKWLECHMPDLHSWFHYRSIDVSSFKCAIRMWYPTVPEFVKDDLHRSLPDIEESIAELEFYRRYFFKHVEDGFDRAAAVAAATEGL